MKLVLHIGHPKCGSTSVQGLLWHNREALARQGAQLLGAGLAVPGETGDWDWPLWYLQAAGPQLAEALRARRQDFASRGVSTLILSAENLSIPEVAANLVAALPEFETQVIYYMRRQDAFLVSSWRQWGLKRGTDIYRHLLRRVAEGKPRFLETLEFYRQHVGGALHATFLDERFLDGGTLASDLFAALGVAGLAEAPVPGNPSPDRAALLLAARHPEWFASEHDDAVLQDLLQADPLPPRPLRLDRHLQRSLKLAYDPVNIAIARDYLGREDGASVLPLDSEVTGDPFALDDADIARLQALLPRLHDPRVVAAIRNLDPRGY